MSGSCVSPVLERECVTVRGVSVLARGGCSDFGSVVWLLLWFILILSPKNNVTYIKRVANCQQLLFFLHYSVLNTCQPSSQTNTTLPSVLLQKLGQPDSRMCITKATTQLSHSISYTATTAYLGSVTTAKLMLFTYQAEKGATSTSIFRPSNF